MQTPLNELGIVREDGSILLYDKNRDYQRIRPTVEQKEYLQLKGLQWVASSFISGVGTSEMQGLVGDDLYIRFWNGSYYMYPGLGFHFDKMTRANSKGKYFWRYIRRTKGVKLESIPFDVDVMLDDDKLFEAIAKDISENFLRIFKNVAKEIIIDEATGREFYKMVINGENVFLLIDKKPT